MNIEETNSSFVRPALFYISGFYNFAHGRYYYIFLCFVYIMTVFGNVVLLLIILLVRSLHTPKYMIVFNLALTDLCGSTALIPKLLDTFLFENRYISYEACLSYMFFVLFFGSMQSWTLAVMAFDRFIAICFPLHYHNVVTKPAVSGMLLFVWLLPFIVMGTVVGLVSQLSFCNSLVVQSFYCDHAPVYRLACSSTVVNQGLALFGGAIIFLVPMALIGCSYLSIAFALKRNANGGERFKALKTCTSHLMLVAIFFIPLTTTNIVIYFPNFHPNTRMINSTLTHTVPSLLNPFIYSLKTEEVLTVIQKI
ncbi:putative gustatory receptor clone PTE01 [Periophthalmus magnuspinnatus]|uniref:putative gustatory receptor clone PTE01 n=1 Tax=Periophthalmus magnuspinnatus TaxID=409849 RepID=UPI0024370384|nr:putative gustatory receptor clone PTE01 [Periophthalmus magnuspinnatus]